MQINIKILSAVVNSRVLRSGDDKGQTKFSVDLYAHTGDMVPSKFVISGLASEADAQAIVAKFPHNTSAALNLVPRDALWIDLRDIQPATK
jgi:hypothetical protein